MLSEFSDSGWKVGNIDNLLKRIHKTGTIFLSDNQAAAVRYNGGLDPLVVSNFNFYF